MKKNIRVDGKRIYLKTLIEDDASEEYVGWINDKDVNQYLETKRTTLEELRSYITKKKEDENCLFLGIYFKENNKHIGNIKLEPIDFKKKIATMGMLIGDKKYWGRGLATEALNLLVEWSFNNLDLDEIDLGVLKDNAAAIRVYEKAGFKIKAEKEKGFTMSRRRMP